MNRLINTAEMEWIGQQEKHRTGALNFKNLFQGDEGDPNNFRLVMSRANGDYTSPHHRHNFDQIRYVIEGSANIGPGKDLGPGDLGYFPEGTHYGPQEDLAGSRVGLVLQFGGASGLGYMSAAQLKRGQEDLAEVGSFGGGRYRRRGAAEDQDSYEAIWEHVFGRRIEYPAPRYADPILIRPAGFAWTTVGPGVDEKALGSFTERGTRAAMVRIEAGRSLALGEPDARVLVFVLAGEGDVDGRTFRRHAALEVPPDKTCRLTPTAEAQMLTITLPLLPRDGARAVTA